MLMIAVKNQEAMESAEEDDSPYSQTCRRRDPVYLASMAAHALPTSQVCFCFLCCLHIFTQYLFSVAIGHTQYFQRTHRALVYSSLICTIVLFILLKKHFSIYNFGFGSRLFNNSSTW